jgi:hypothetical protein
MIKPKRKNQQENIWQYFWREYVLFERLFEFETRLSLEETIYTIQRLTTRQQKGWFTARKRRTIATIEQLEDRVTFRVDLEQPSRSGYSLSARAEGELHAGTDHTLITGRATVAGSSFLIGVVALTLFLGYMGLFVATEMLTSIIIIPLALAFWWYRMYQDRNAVILEIEQLVNTTPSLEEYPFKQKTSDYAADEDQNQRQST